MMSISIVGQPRSKIAILAYVGYVPMLFIA